MIKNTENNEQIRKTAPKQLPYIGQYLWDKLVKADDQLTKIDEPNLELYCANYALYRQALQEIEREGIVIDSDNGLRKHPAVSIVDTASKTMRSLSTALGFDKNVRAIVIEDEDDSDILEAFKFD